MKISDPKDYQVQEDITPDYEDKFEQIKSIFDILMLGYDILDIDKTDNKKIPSKLIIRFILNNLNFIFKTHLLNCIEEFLKQTPVSPVSVNLDYYNLTIDLLYVLYKNQNEMTGIELLPETIDIFKICWYYNSGTI